MGLREASRRSKLAIDGPGGEPDRFGDLRRSFHDADNPIPGDAYDRLVAKGGRFIPSRGRLLVRRQEAYCSAKAAGLVIPEMADVHHGGQTAVTYEVLAVGPHCDEGQDEERGGCTDACRLEPGERVIASAHLGADLRSWGGPELFMLRCSRVGAVMDA